MTDYRTVFSDVAYLASCAVNGEIPDAARVGNMDLSARYAAAERHQLTGITGLALESADVKDAAFAEAVGKAVRREAVFDVECAAVLAGLEKAGVWYMLLKGQLLKRLYPRMGMRQMADVDILYDASRTADVRTILEGLGFTAGKRFGIGVHDSFDKPPICHFELHRTLFSESQNNRFYVYYRDVKDRLLPDGTHAFGYRFSDEDFYVYITAHEYKHYSIYGTGLRSLLDAYVYVTKKPSLDWDYIKGELDKLGIAEFEEQTRTLAFRLFDQEPLTERDRGILDFYLSSGTYGTVSNGVKIRIGKDKGKRFKKLRYVFGRLFLPIRTVKENYPLFIRLPFLLPFLPVYRLFRGMKHNKKALMTEWKTLKSGCDNDSSPSEFGGTKD